jgi:hypothetical protein
VKEMRRELCDLMTTNTSMFRKKRQACIVLGGKKHIEGKHHKDWQKGVQTSFVDRRDCFNFITGALILVLYLQNAGLSFI